MSATIGELEGLQIESLLRAEIVARIAYVDGAGVPQIVPIAYAYDGAARGSLTAS